MSFEDKNGFVRVRALISGRVQHVGFRYWACEQAERLGLTGSVKNLPDRSVEIFIQGRPENVSEMKEKLKRGPSMAVVKELIFYNEKVRPDETFFECLL